MNSAPGEKDHTLQLETRRRHAIENQNRDLLTVQALELKLELTARWIPGDMQCHETAKLLHMRKYQRALDVLEGLVVAHVFELSKMNCSQTGESYACLLAAGC